MRQGRWKLVEFYDDGRRTLHDLDGDLGEAQDLAADQPDRVQEMAKQLDRWRAGIHAPEPVPVDS